MGPGENSMFKDGVYILSDGTEIPEGDMIDLCQSLDALESNDESRD
jgi:hypothetical protein